LRKLKIIKIQPKLFSLSKSIIFMSVINLKEKPKFCTRDKENVRYIPSITLPFQLMKFHIIPLAMVVFTLNTQKIIGISL